MPLKFDKYVNNYTVEIKEDVTKLEIEYICNNDDLVTIKNNDNLDFGINHIFIEVVNNEEKIPNYVPIGLIVGGFFIILLTFWILFHKKK